MRNILRFFHRYRWGVLLLLAQILGYGMTLAQSPSHHSGYWSSRLAVQGAWKSTIDNWRWYFNLGQEIQKVSEQHAALAQQVHGMDPNRGVLYWFINSVDTTQYEWKSGRITFAETHRQHNRMIINMGARDGIQPGDGILSTQGVVGTVVQVSNRYARVMPVLDIDFKMSAATQDQGYYGSLRWDGHSPKEALWEHVAFHAQVRPGDTLVTAGQSGVFPAGWPLAVVHEVVLDSAQMTLSSRVGLLHDFGRLSAIHAVHNRFTMQDLLPDEEE